MKIKKFTARTFSEALSQVRKELGSDAIILSTEEKRGLRPHVEIAAAVDYDTEPMQTAEPSTRTQAEGCGMPHEPHEPGPEFTAPRLFPAPHHEAAAELKGEIASLREMILDLKNRGYEMSLPAKKRAMMNFLVERSVREEYAFRLCDKAAELEDLSLHISSDIKIKRSAGAKKAVMLVGPTGVGKTTTVAKLAAHAVKSGKKAAIINLDTYRIGAPEQMRIYARILGIPLAVASGAVEFRSSLVKLAEGRDVVFVDTTGRNPKDDHALAEMAELCRTDFPLEVHLLMAANADDQCMIEAHDRYSRLPIDYLAFTKIDEAARFGQLYNLLLTYRKPVAYLTTGQRVPGDIEFATVSRLAGLIVGKDC